MTHQKLYEAVVIGVSAGGLAALEAILSVLDPSFTLPVFIVQHISPESESYLSTHFSSRCALPVKEAEDKEDIQKGIVYFAPPNYHLLVERGRTLALSSDERVNFSRPSVDVLFESAADTYAEGLVGIILTGANNDGAAGLAKIKSMGGLTIVQSPHSAQVDVMPRAALLGTDVDHVIDLDQIGSFLNALRGFEWE